MVGGNDSPQLIRLQDIRKACSTCSLRELCLPVALGREDTEALDHIVERNHPLRKGDKLCRSGQPFTAIHAVLSGSLKSSTQGQDGEDQVIAFHLPGELVGLDAIGVGSHPSTIEALETTSVCKIPFSQLEDLARQIPGLQHQLLRIMSKEIFDDHDLGNFLGLAPETTSRLFKRFVEYGWLNVTGKEVELLDLPALQALTESKSAPLRSSKQG